MEDNKNIDRKKIEEYVMDNINLIHATYDDIVDMMIEYLKKNGIKA